MFARSADEASRQARGEDLTQRERYEAPEEDDLGRKARRRCGAGRDEGDAT